MMLLTHWEPQGASAPTSVRWAVTAHVGGALGGFRCLDVCKLNSVRPVQVHLCYTCYMGSFHAPLSPPSLAFKSQQRLACLENLWRLLGTDPEARQILGWQPEPHPQPLPAKESPAWTLGDSGPPGSHMLRRGSRNDRSLCARDHDPRWSSGGRSCGSVLPLGRLQTAQKENSGFPAQFCTAWPDRASLGKERRL